MHALVYIYSRIFECCESLALQFTEQLDKKIPNANVFDSLRDETRRVHYVKLNGLQKHKIITKLVEFDHLSKPPEEFCEAFNNIQFNTSLPNNFEKVIEFYTKMVELTFNHYGNHDSMLFLLNEKWNPIDMIETQFADQADKFIFWRYIADRIKSLNAFGIVWISESWIRKPKQGETAPIRNMQIVGERLHTIIFDKLGNKKEIGWEIIRGSITKKPTLKPILEKDTMLFHGNPYFLVPVIRALGLEPLG